MSPCNSIIEQLDSSLDKKKNTQQLGPARFYDSNGNMLNVFKGGAFPASKADHQVNIS